MKRPGKLCGWSSLLVWPEDGAAGWRVACVLRVGSSQVGVSGGTKHCGHLVHGVP